MTSEKQIEANRLNAQKSTGPMTVEGKAIVCRNAVKHGILSEHVPLDEVDILQYEGFSEEMIRHLKPRNHLQRLLADRIVSTAWRLRRVVHVETLMLQKASKSPDSNSNSYRDAFSGTAAQNMAILSRYERTLENAMFRSLRELHIQREKDNQEMLWSH